MLPYGCIMPFYFMGTLRHSADALEASLTETCLLTIMPPLWFPSLMEPITNSGQLGWKPSYSPLGCRHIHRAKSLGNTSLRMKQSMRHFLQLIRLRYSPLSTCLRRITAWCLGRSHLGYRPPFSRTISTAWPLPHSGIDWHLPTANRQPLQSLKTLRTVSTLALLQTLILTSTLTKSSVLMHT